MRKVSISVTEKQWSMMFEHLFKALGYVGYHTYDSRRSEPGYPDWHIVHPAKRRSIFVELKAEQGRISSAQQWWLDTLRDCGCEAYIWRPSDFAEAERVLKRP